MIVYVNPNISGNVFIRVAPNQGAPSSGVPAYNFKNLGILYEVDNNTRNEETGEIWYHLRGLGWSMARYFETYEGAAPAPDPDPGQDQTKRWLVGLTEDQVRECIAYLENVISGESVD